MIKSQLVFLILVVVLFLSVFNNARQSNFFQGSVITGNALDIPIVDDAAISDGRPELFDVQPTPSSEIIENLPSQVLLPPAQQQPQRLYNVPRLVVTDFFIPPAPRLGGPQLPTASQPGGAEYGAEYFIAYAKGSGGVPRSIAVFGLGPDGIQWSGERIIGSVIDPGNSLVRLAAFGNRVVYSQWTASPYPLSEIVLGKEAMHDGFLGTGDDRLFVLYYNPTIVSYTWVDVVRNAALYKASAAGTPQSIVFHHFGSDHLAGTVDDVGELVTQLGYSPCTKCQAQEYASS